MEGHAPEVYVGEFGSLYENLYCLEDSEKGELYGRESILASTEEKILPQTHGGETMKGNDRNGALCNRKGEKFEGTTSLTSSRISDVRKKAQLPVAPSASTSAINAYFHLGRNQSQTQATKRSSTSTALAATQSTAETSASEMSTGGMSFLRNNFPFFRNSTSRSRSQSVVSDVSRSSEATGDSKREKDKSYRRKSHLNRAFTDEPVPDDNFAFDFTPKSSKPTSQEGSSLENSAMEERRSPATSKPNVKRKSISRQNSNENKTFESNAPASPTPTSKEPRKGTPVVKKDSFSDAEGVSFIKKMLQKESDRNRVAAAASTSGKQNSQSSLSNAPSNYNIKKSPSAGNQSYWSKFSSSQSAFLRKLFDKPKVSDCPANQTKSSNNSKNSSKNNQLNNSVDKETKLEENSSEKDSSEKENAEPVLGFSVAQKASFFMKLEHEQRFSKWRKSSVDLGIISKTNSSNLISSLETMGKGNDSMSNVNGTNNCKEFRPRSSRYLTQPVTPTELMDIAPLVNSYNYGSSVKSENRLDKGFGLQPRNCWDDNVKEEGFAKMENEMTDSSGILNKDSSSAKTKSFYKDCDEFNKFVTTSDLKGRVGQFDEILTQQQPIETYSAAPLTPTMKSYSLTRSVRTNGHQENGIGHLGNFPMYHSASAIISNSSTTNSIITSKISEKGGGGSSSTKSSGTFYKNPCVGYSSSSSSFSEAMSRHGSTKFLPLSKGLSNSRRSNNLDSPVFENHASGKGTRRRGSASDLEPSGPAAVQIQQSPLLPRDDRVKSMFVARAPPTAYHCDTENLSEDGEFSSGGQEVAEIICRSYENSPVFRKKNWRSHKQAQANFTKEIWRRCGNYENWNQRSYSQKPQPPQHPTASAVPQTFTATTNVIEVSTAPPAKLPPVAPSPPPATSNLLQILTVLSSSNDELNETKPKTKKYQNHHRQGSSSKIGNLHLSGVESIPPTHPGSGRGHHNQNSLNTMTPQSDQMFVAVPHPEDEAFQSFFCSVKSFTQVTNYPTACIDGEGSLGMNGQMIANGGVDHVGQTDLENEEALDIASVRRESDLLVMKKNIPTAKRKSSSSSKYKNPLRALAARMDFRQQGYIQSTSNTSNTVQSSSDVDVTT